MIHYLSVNGLVQTAVLQNCRISDLVLAQQAEQLEQTPEKVYETMAQSLSVMRQAVIDGTYPDLAVNQWIDRWGSVQNEMFGG